MSNVRLPIAVCSVVGDLFASTASHSTLDALFMAAGAPLPIPDAAHHSKWKIWLVQAGNDPNVDSLSVLGQLLSEFMDLPPDADSESYESWVAQRDRLEHVLEENGLRYFRGGRILPNGETALSEIPTQNTSGTIFPNDTSELVSVLVRGLPRAMHPLTHRRKGSETLSFDSEYDVQDLLHSLLRPWVADIRPEEYTPSYAGRSTRMDFLLPKYGLVIEMKFVRDREHGKKIGDELIIDIEHYRRHPSCERLWCVIYDPNNLLVNPTGLVNDLEGERRTADGDVTVTVKIVSN